MRVGQVPFLETNVAQLSGLLREINEIEESGIYSNYGPMNTKFESALISTVFGGVGSCVTVCNATIGLMIALKYVTRHVDRSQKPYVLMPSFTFAAAAHAVIWAGFTPLFADIDPHSWTMSAESEAQILASQASKIAAIFPYAAFGNAIDLGRYIDFYESYGIPTVVDAASSLGSLNLAGHGFGTGFPFPIVFSLHATKALGVGEGGFIYSDDAGMIQQLRAMGNFGFERPRHATIDGINSKMPEISALLGLDGLKRLEAISRKKDELAQMYRDCLPDFTFQTVLGRRSAYQFMPVLLPERGASRRDQVLARMKDSHIGIATYFSPHLAEQKYFVPRAETTSLPVTDRIASGVVSLPLGHRMTSDTIQFVCDEFRRSCQQEFN
ncbi:DegT/DnrJ/EryC1/StrS family aminotransferase [Nguyenibacter vanlangensis]|uniref:DegT/DnrJ/EryC1/StrS family aminotransferase n=1 Tax=Nguyenibacter vanlangensis TaxID=1216886 RepID=A0A7Y7IVI8_9PROT|nr:DegT/DnrJ/EryC1/StrS family aminotransferase [Nguyenibacter vanlangensis]NVN10858.1 DegT/DnrJ/EryC1/StrS family aminotransferase [Nguyenibacter vanlangensis]